eukprot:525189_1
MMAEAQSVDNVEIVITPKSERLWKCNQCNHVNNIIETFDVKCSNCQKSTYHINPIVPEEPEEEEKYATPSYLHNTQNIKIITTDTAEEKITPHIGYKSAPHDKNDDIILNIIASKITKEKQNNKSSLTKIERIDALFKKHRKWNADQSKKPRTFTSYQSMDNIYKNKASKKRESFINIILKKTSQRNEGLGSKKRLSLLHNQTKEINLISNFVEVRDDDYLCNGDITKCNAIKRVIHLLEYYKTYQIKLMENEVSVFPMYEYITSSLKNYSVGMFLEDWHQCKKNHFKTESDIEYFTNIEEICCMSAGSPIIQKSCIYVRRYERDRNNNTYDMEEEIDLKNIILMDKLNAIHTYIFHFISTRFRNMQKHLFDIDDISHDDEKKEAAQVNRENIDIWSNNPASIIQCNVEQIIYILYRVILDDEKLKKLSDHRDAIINYIKDNEYNGRKILETKKKPFITQIVEHFDDKKLRGPFTNLYKRIIGFEVWQFNVWYNNPSSIKECNVEQIVHILNHRILDDGNLAKLKDHREGIINYIHENKFNGRKILETGKKAFITQIAEHFNDNKLKGSFTKLYKRIIDCEISKYTNTQPQSNDDNVSLQNRKYVTEMQHFAFGEQYKYTKNLASHPLYVEEKYKNLKEEALSSGYCPFVLFQQKVIGKANEWIHTEKIKKIKAKWSVSSQAKDYGVKENEQISYQHLQSVILYTDFSELCTSFSSTFRPMYFGESIESIKKRNRYYFHLSKTLRETVECFGNGGYEDYTH